MSIRCEKCRTLIDPVKTRPIATMKTATKVTEKYKCPNCNETFTVEK